MSIDDTDSESSVPTGPRGGTTTVTGSGMVKKNLWVERELAEELRRRAFEDRTSEAELMRQGLRWVLGFAEEAES